MTALHESSREALLPSCEPENARSCREVRVASRSCIWLNLILRESEDRFLRLTRHGGAEAASTARCR